MKSVFARISTAIVAIAAVAASALVFAPAASATVLPAATVNDYRLSLSAPGDSVEATSSASRLEFQSNFRYNNVTSLRGQNIQVQSVNTGLGSNSSMQDSAYVEFYTGTDFLTRVSGGGQIYQRSSGAGTTSITIPNDAVAMTISYMSYFNGGGYQTVAQGTLSSTPHVYLGGTDTSYTSATASTAGLYYRVDGLMAPSFRFFTTSSSLATPVQGTITSTTFKAATCVDISGWTSGTTAYTVKPSINGTDTSSNNDNNFAWDAVGASPNGMSAQYGSTTSGSGQSAVNLRSRIDTLKSNNVTKIQIVGTLSGTGFATNATSYTAGIDIVDQNNHSVTVSCTPSAPTGSGTLAYAASAPTPNPNSGGGGFPGNNLYFTPDSSFTTINNWGVNVYRADTNALVGTGSGMQQFSTTVTSGSGGLVGPPTPLPVGVPLYAKAFVAASLTLDTSLGSVTLQSAESSAQSQAFTIPIPVISLATGQPSGLSTAGSAQHLPSTVDMTAGFPDPATGYLMDTVQVQFGMSAIRAPQSDGKDGFYTWKDTQTGTGQSATMSLKLYHYKASGLDTSFGGGTGNVPLSTDSHGAVYTMGWYGTRDTWAGGLVTYQTTSTAYPTPFADIHYGLDLITGNMTSGTATTRSFTYQQMDTYCNSVWAGSGFKSSSVKVLNSPTSSPLLVIPCGKSETLTGAAGGTVLSRGTIALAGPSGLSLVTKLNDADTTVDNVYSIFSATAYPNASASTDTAAAIVLATAKVTTYATSYPFSDSPSTLSVSNTPNTVHRKLIRITKAGVATELLDASAWVESSPGTTTVYAAKAAAPVLPPMTATVAGDTLVGFRRVGSTYSVQAPTGSNGFAALVSGDALTFDPVAPTGLTVTSLTWPGGNNIVSNTGTPQVVRYYSNPSSMVTTNNYVIAQSKIDWATHIVHTDEAVAFNRPSSAFVTYVPAVDSQNRLTFWYTSATGKMDVVRWVGAASLPDGVAVNSQSTSYVLNAGGDVVLTGTGLGAASGATKVLTAKVNGVSAVIKARTATTLTITAPANANATAQSPVTGNIELGFADDQGGVVGQLTYVGATKLTPVITQTVSGASTAYFGDADRDFSASATMSPVTVTPVNTTSAACSIVNNKVRFLAAGTCTVTSTVAATSYSNAASQSTSITVNKPTATITLNVGALTAYASDADRTVTATAVLDTSGTSPDPVVSATPASVCAIVAGKVDFVGAGNCLVKATIASSTAINGDTEQATIVVTKVTPTVSVSVAGATSGLVGDEDRAITVTASAGTATVTSNTPLVCSIVPAVDQSPIKVHFIGAGNCVVKAQVASSATLNASNAALSTAVAVLLPDVITPGFADGDAANAAASADGAVTPVITVASGRDYTLTSADTTKCAVTDDGLLWFKAANQDCVITIATTGTSATYAAGSYTWTIGMLPAVGSDANSALQVPNNGVVTKLATTSLTWAGSTNQVKLNLYTKYVGLFKARMSFVVNENGVDNTYSCDVKFGSATKVTGAAIKAVKTFTSLPFCTDVAGLTVPQKTAQTTVYNKFKALVAANKALGLGTTVSLSYQFEKHFANTGALYTGETLLSNAQKAWSTTSYANLFYLAFDKITTALPTGVPAAVSADASGAFNTVVTLDSKRTDYTLTSGDTTKCAVLSDNRIWAKVAGQDCVITVATANNAIYKAKSAIWTIPMVAAVGADLASAPIAPSNGTAVNIGPLTFTWTQATSTVIAKVNNRNAGLASVKMTFTPLATVAVPNPADVTCTVNFGATKTAGAVDAIKTQTSAKFCTGADLTKFTALVAAKKTASAVIPVTFAYKFEQHNPATGVIIGDNLATLPWSSNVVVKLNYRATAN